MVSAVPPPWRMLTVEDYLALDEDETSRWELQEGNLVTTPSPTPRHNIASAQLLIQLDPQLPDDVRVVPDVDLDLHLAGGRGPGWVRRPDLVVVRREAVERVARDGGLLRAEDALLVVEVLSPGSVRTDRVIKLGEYADAGIEHYWIVDLDEPASVTAYVRSVGPGFQDVAPVTGVFTSDEPFPVRIDLAALS